MSYGRPLMIHSSIEYNSFTLPSAVDDELLTCYPDAPGSQPSSRPSRVECYVQTLQLGGILGQVLTSFYHQGSETQSVSKPCINREKDKGRSNVLPGHISSSRLQKLLDVDEQLNVWMKNLPAHLQVPNDADGIPSAASIDFEEGTMFRRQAMVLKARYVGRGPSLGGYEYGNTWTLANYPRALYVRLILLRPLLSELCDSANKPTAESNQHGSTSPSMLQSMLMNPANLCVSVAQDLAHLITENSRSKAHLLPPPWYIILCR